jgi:hypothetical protein
MLLVFLVCIEVNRNLICILNRNYLYRVGIQAMTPKLRYMLTNRRNNRDRNLILTP